MLAIFLKRNTNFSFDTLFVLGGSLSASFSLVLPIKLCGASFGTFVRIQEPLGSVQKVSL
jgi:hypothetical protein